MSRQKIKIDVWKYIRPILMGLGAFLKVNPAHPERVLSQHILKFLFSRKVSKLSTLTGIPMGDLRSININEDDVG